jgi:hypothetical protein
VVRLARDGGLSSHLVGLFYSQWGSLMPISHQGASSQRERSEYTCLQWCKIVTERVACASDLGIGHNLQDGRYLVEAVLVEDTKTGPLDPSSTVFKGAEGAKIVAFRCRTLLTQHGCLYAYEPSVPNLTLSALHRRLQRRSSWVS